MSAHPVVVRSWALLLGIPAILATGPLPSERVALLVRVQLISLAVALLPAPWPFAHGGAPLVLALPADQL